MQLGKGPSGNKKITLAAVCIQQLDQCRIQLSPILTAQSYRFRVLSFSCTWHTEYVFVLLCRHHGRSDVAYAGLAKTKFNLKCSGCKMRSNRQYR